MSWVTNTIVRPSSRIRLNTSKHFCCERGVADGENLVDQQDVRVDLNRHREREPDVHAGGVVLELELLELAQFGEVDDRVIARAGLARGEAHHDPVEHDVVARGEILVEADAELDEGRQAPVHPDSSAVDAVDAGQALQQRALAAPVAPGDPEELARAHVEGDVAQRFERLMAGAAQRVQRALLERVRALLGHAERLADRLGRRSGARTSCWRPMEASGEGYRGRVRSPAANG